MKELRFDTGLVSYKVNDSCEITFNPGDINFTKHLFDLFDTLSARQEVFDKDDPDAMDGKELFRLTEERDAQMREDVDGLFGEGTSKALFGKMSIFALAGGFPLWANLLMAIIDEIDENLVREEQKGRERVDKYMRKYKAYKRK